MIPILTDHPATIFSEEERHELCVEWLMAQEQIEHVTI